MGKTALLILSRVGDPGAIGLLVLLGVGVCLCFQGARLFRFSAGVAGFVVGMELSGQLAAAQGWGVAPTLLVALLGGAALATLLVVFSFLGVFGLGAMLATSLVSLAAAASDAALQPLTLVLTGLIGGFGAFVLRKPVVVVATSLYGALAAMAALFALASGQGMKGAVSTMASPRQTGEVALFLLCLAVLITGGIAVQFRYGKNAALDGAGIK